MIITTLEVKNYFWSKFGLISSTQSKAIDISGKFPV